MMLSVNKQGGGLDSRKQECVFEFCLIFPFLFDFCLSFPLLFDFCLPSHLISLSGKSFLS